MNYIDLNELNSYNVELDAESGDYIHCRRQYSQTGAFSCTGVNTIVSSADVAFLMRSLQEYSVEHSFVCCIKDDGSPYLLHLGMGTFDACMINKDTIRYTADRLDAKQVYMIHNHPSGTLAFGKSDRIMHHGLEEVLGERMKGSIVINTTSGKYLFAQHSQAEETVNDMSGADTTGPAVQVLEFDRQVFAKDWDYHNAVHIRGSYDVASFLSSQRFGHREKSGMLIMNKGMKVVANVQLPYSTLTRSKVVHLAPYMQNCTCAFGGVAVLPYFTGKVSAMAIRLLNAEFKKISSFDMVDVCHNINVKFQSAVDDNLLNFKSQTIGHIF